MQEDGMRRISRIIFTIVFLNLALIVNFMPVTSQSTSGETAVVMKINGPLVSTHTEYLKRSLGQAVDMNAQVLIMELDTPGGSVDILNEIVKVMRSSPIPIVVYVSPRGAMAASAGTIITLAGHVAAMAPETTIGAASPVGQQGEDIGATMESKVKEILKATVRSISTGRSSEAVSLAEETIEKARAVTVVEALRVGLVDLSANDEKDLLNQLEGRVVNINSKTLALHTREARIVRVEYTLIEQLLQFLTNPNILFLLLSIGVQAILIEISSPGGWAAGTIGAVCLIVAFYGMGLLPVNWFGLLFLVVAFILFILEIKAPTHGALTAAGAAAFIAGSLILFNSARLPGFPPVSIPLVVGVGVILAASFFLIVVFALRAQISPILVGKEILPGQTGLVVGDLLDKGYVRVAGELWSAEHIPGTQELQDGDAVEIVAVDGLRLRVRKKS
jgi:membrane-bound serine protease (ClpP class)